MNVTKMLQNRKVTFKINLNILNNIYLLKGK